MSINRVFKKPTPTEAEKRSVSTDALATLGTIIDKSEKRDAIHIAVEPVRAGHQLRPGDHVGWLDEPGSDVGCCENPIGIVDPFLKGFIKKGEMFWLLVYPRQITSLRHVWSHPAFPENMKKEVKEDDDDDEEYLSKTDDWVKKKKASPTTAARLKAKVWLQSFAREKEINFSEMMERAELYLEQGTYWIEGGRFEGMSFDVDEFWDNYEVYKNETVTEENRNSFFSCSC